MEYAWAPLLECSVLLSIGFNLRQFGVLSEFDGETAVKVATFLTLPAVIIRAFCCQGPLYPDVCLGMAFACICFAVQAVSSWTYCALRPPRERAVLAGCGLGLAMTHFGYPLVEALFGLSGVQSLAVMDLANCCAIAVSYMLFASAGPAFPDSFKHEDGGYYRGQWRGMRKEGLGVYCYPSGAKYEGEWRDNLKDGRGVYYYPKGGTYEGEWAGGVMSGTGVRTFSSGQVKAGRWRDGQLDSPLDLWQCANAAEGAAEAALASRRVEVGGGKVPDALQQLMLYPPLWVTLVVIAVNVAAVPLPSAIDAVTASLAPANRPLMLIAAGLSIPKIEVPPLRIIADVAHVVTSRLIVPLAIGGALLLLLALTNTSLGAVEGLSISVAILCSLAPIPPSAQKYAHSFRLNEPLSHSLASTSLVVSLPLMALFGLLASATAPGPLPLATGSALALSVTGNHMYTLAGFCLLTAAGLGAAMAVFLQKSAEHAKKVLTVKPKPVGDTGARLEADSGPAGAAAAAVVPNDRRSRQAGGQAGTKFALRYPALNFRPMCPSRLWKPVDRRTINRQLQRLAHANSCRASARISI